MSEVEAYDEMAKQAKAANEREVDRFNQSGKQHMPVALRVDEISISDARNLFDASVKKVKYGPQAVLVPEHMEYRPIASPAARHIAEKIRQSIAAESVMVYDVFGKKRVKVMLDLEIAEEFAREVVDGTP